jgi:hydrogenase nickel incorporation protein HypA/HybF
MHEYSIVQALVERVEAEARARHAAAVHRLSIRIGELSGVDVELLTTAYATFRERTICQGAELDVQRIPARWECPDCGEDVRSGTMLRCARCGAPARLATGDEIVLDRIEMEVL